MGCDNERYHRTKKDTFDFSFISFEISHSRFSDYHDKIYYIELGYSIPDFLILGYLRNIPKISRDTPGISNTWSYL
jgi:hypothetical protein